MKKILVLNNCQFPNMKYIADFTIEKVAVKFIIAVVERHQFVLVSPFYAHCNLTLFAGELKVIEIESFLQQVHNNTFKHRRTSSDINVRHIIEYCADLGSTVIGCLLQEK